MWMMTGMGNEAAAKMPVEAAERAAAGKTPVTAPKRTVRRPPVPVIILALAGVGVLVWWFAFTNSYFRDPPAGL